MDGALMTSMTACVGSEKSLAGGKTREVDRDLSTPDGQRAYQGFIKTGRLPEAGSGVANRPARGLSTTTPRPSSPGSRRS
jgi:hypothetical protein